MVSEPIYKPRRYNQKASKLAKAVTKEAQSVMLAELRMYGFANASQFATVTWEDWKKQNPEVTYAMSIVLQ